MFPEDIFQEAKFHYVTGDFKGSVALFSEAEKEGCNPLNVHLNKGAAYLNLKEYDLAIDDFNQVLKIDTDNERAYFYRGVAYLNKGEFASAAEDLTQSIRLNHNRGTAFFARGLANAELDNVEDALRDLKTAIAFSGVEVGKFLNQYGSHRTTFDKTMALFEGERGPWSMVLTKEDVEKFKRLMKD